MKIEYNGRTVVVPDAPKIIDDGTMDTVVWYRGASYRFATDYRNTFDNDGAFLLAVEILFDNLTAVIDQIEDIEREELIDEVNGQP